ncbi:MAG: DnaJ domain-containing protein [Candidatus Sumerlaeia bacterium]|nr:DnaJ domain-containing protein [Candidatus Sumerlaeia bacterium]
MRILYVSDTDLCRGPMARLLSLRHAEAMQVVGASFDSAGLWTSKPARSPREIVEFLRDDRLDVTRHMSKPLQPAQVRASDLILCMTHRLAEKTQAAIEEPHRPKVLVLNEAVGFGESKKDEDIVRPPANTNKELLVVYSRLKAATGRLVRMMRDGNTTPEDFGVTSVASHRMGYLDDPLVRPFLASFVGDLVGRTSGGITVREIVSALDVLGRPLSIEEVEELLAHDLRQKVRRNHLKRWEVRPVAERKAASPPPPPPRDAGPRKAPPPPPKSPPPPKPPPANGKISFAEALKVLSVTAGTPREEAQKKYRQLLTRYHPDKFHDDDSFRHMAEEKTKLINQAWAVVEEKLGG